MVKKPKRPRDPNQLAKLIVDIATGEAENVKPVAPNSARIIWSHAEIAGLSN